MEFIIRTDLENSLPSVIDFNFEELKNGLSEQLAYYNSLVITPDGIKGGKEDRAKLNKLKTAVDDRRKEVKRLCLAPYEDFEIKCKTLTGMIDTASGSIDKQVKAFEDAEKEEKRAQIEAAYIEFASDVSALLPLERVFSPKWLNKGTPLPAAIDELKAAIEKSRNDIKIIRTMGCPCEDQMIAAYLVSLDMSAALGEKSRYEVRQAQLAKMAAQSPPFVAPEQSEPTAERPAQVAAYTGRSPTQEVSAEVSKTIKVIFYDTTAAFRTDMKSLTDKHNVKYGGIE